MSLNCVEMTVDLLSEVVEHILLPPLCVGPVHDILPV